MHLMVDDVNRLDFSEERDRAERVLLAASAGPDRVAVPIYELVLLPAFAVPHRNDLDVVHEIK